MYELIYFIANVNEVKKDNDKTTQVANFDISDAFLTAYNY